MTVSYGVGVGVGVRVVVGALIEEHANSGRASVPPERVQNTGIPLTTKSTPVKDGAACPFAPAAPVSPCIPMGPWMVNPSLPGTPGVPVID